MRDIQRENILKRPIELFVPLSGDIYSWCYFKSSNIVYLSSFITF